ncbi:MAG: TraB/GumN family protein [Thermodesulfobacteriota bacterium]|nr:TraB/GumN family protein [Thermodesulfobacteriota bacterium]
MSVERFSRDGREIVLLGTAHVSRDSVEEVQQLMAETRPDVVAIELCQGRYDIIKNPDAWRQTDIMQVIKDKKASLLFANLIMSSFQKRIGAKLGIRPGQEMIAAIDAAEAAGIEIALIDRPIQPTLKRAWRMLSFFERMRLIFSGIGSVFAADDIEEEDIERLKEQDVLTAAIEEIAHEAPIIKKVLIDERDAYMARKLSDLGNKRVMAVVGAGHLQGMMRNLETPDADLTELEKVPEKKGGFWKWVIPVLVLAFVIGGFFFKGQEQGYEIVKWWLLCNAVFASLGAIAAMAHPITILVAGIISPITSLNPTLAAGWFAGLSEAYLRRPTVEAFEDLQTDTSTVRGFWRNPITRILMVVVFANLGSSLGAFVAMPILAKIIFSG